MLNVLWLVSWYPSRVDAFNGDFIERHAHAVSAFVKLTILYIVKDERLVKGKVDVEKTTAGNLTVYKVYYGKSASNQLAEQFFSFRKYTQLQKQLYQQIEADEGKPALVHVHVAMKAGMLAMYLKQNFAIKYVVTEHWSGYFKESLPNVYEGNAFLKRLNKKVLAGADKLFPVSENLGASINKNFVPVQYQVIPNVVNTLFFNYQPSPHARFRFIHPSMMNANKNPFKILEAFAAMQNKGYNIELLMAGNLDETLISYAKALKLKEDTVVFKPAIAYKEVATEMQQSTALLLFSNYESLPCVILEALCCGLPVISSNVGGIAEVITSKNGILVGAGDISGLIGAMCYLIDNYVSFDRKLISENAVSKFNYTVVGQTHLDAYTKLLQP